MLGVCGMDTSHAWRCRTAANAMMGGYTHQGMSAWGWVGMLLMLLFWFGLIALIVAAVMAWGRRQPPVPPSEPREDRALTILRERFARGEVTEDEYQRARRALGDPDR